MMKMNKKTNKAFTLAEVLIALMILCFINLIGLFAFSKLNPKVDKLKFKSANLTFKHAISDMISNPAYYSDEAGLSDLDEVIFDDKYSESGISYAGTEKFRNLLLKELGVQVGTGSLECYMLKNSIKPEKSKYCYKAENGVIWAIPNTDFNATGVINLKNINGGQSAYTPVTMYINANKMDTEEYFYRYAISLGIRSDGAIILIDTGLNCSDKKYKYYAQCDIADTFAALTLKYNKKL